MKTHSYHTRPRYEKSSRETISSSQRFGPRASKNKHTLEHQSTFTNTIDCFTGTLNKRTKRERKDCKRLLVEAASNVSDA